jgi:hypothetical protein
MILILCTLIASDERNVLCTYDCTCVLCTAAVIVECMYGKYYFNDCIIFILLQVVYRRG